MQRNFKHVFNSKCKNEQINVNTNQIKTSISIEDLLTLVLKEFQLLCSALALDIIRELNKTINIAFCNDKPILSCIFAHVILLVWKIY